MKFYLFLTVLFSGLFFSGCERKSAVESESSGSISVGDVSAEQASTLVEQKTQVVDVRTPAEFAEGHIPGAINIDYKGPDFAAEIKKLDGSQPYLIHCQSGGRSGAALSTIQALGFSEIYHLESGMSGWVDAGFPVEK